jgi:hypothetical protein
MGKPHLRSYAILHHSGTSLAKTFENLDPNRTYVVDFYAAERPGGHCAFFFFFFFFFFLSLQLIVESVTYVVGEFPRDEGTRSNSSG